MRWRRAALAGFLVVAWLRTLIADRIPFRAWLRDGARRLGFFPQRLPESIWIHGEGIGEFNAARGLIADLRREGTACRFVFTASRPHTVDWLAGLYPNDVALPHPWDYGPGVSRFFACLRPRLIVLLEFHDGFCPGALLRAQRQGIPVVVVNGRVLHDAKPSRFRIAERLGLVRELATCIDHFCMQDDNQAKTLDRLGISTDRVRATGNLKYDFVPSATAPPEVPSDVPVLVAGCIHPAEEVLIVETFARLRQRHPSLFLILAPNEPGRADDLAALLRSRNLSGHRRSHGPTSPGSDVLILDTFSELAGCYSLATAVVLGGSFTPDGSGHSLVESAAHGRAIVVGPHVRSQVEMVSAFLHHDAVLQRPAPELSATLDELLHSTTLRSELGRKARAVVEQQRGATARTLDALRDMLPANQGRRLERLWTTKGTPSSMKRLARTLALTSPGQLLLRARSRRIKTLDSLRDRLGDPQTILCLGNGPSSEDHRLRTLTHDSLFRVNWRWAGRGVLDRPAVVFTGDHRSLRHCPPCVFGFRTLAEEASVLLNTFFNARPRRVEYFTTERWPIFLDERTWGARPTNGAVMIATAVALRPTRLIVAGIDLFQHPAGRYPGDPAGPNVYAPMHDRAVELAILRHVLNDYHGDLVVIGDVLKKALAA